MVWGHLHKEVTITESRLYPWKSDTHEDVRIDLRMLGLIEELTMDQDVCWYEVLGKTQPSTPAKLSSRSLICPHTLPQQIKLHLYIFSLPHIDVLTSHSPILSLALCHSLSLLSASSWLVCSSHTLLTVSLPGTLLPSLLYCTPFSLLHFRVFPLWQCICFCLHSWSFCLLCSLSLWPSNLVLPPQQDTRISLEPFHYPTQDHLFQCLHLAWKFFFPPLFCKYLVILSVLELLKSTQSIQ